MRDDLLQEILTAVLVLGAAFYVVRRIVLAIRPSAGESSCGGGCALVPLVLGEQRAQAPGDRHDRHTRPHRDGIPAVSRGGIHLTPRSAAVR